MAGAGIGKMCENGRKIVDFGRLPCAAAVGLGVRRARGAVGFPLPPGELEKEAFVEL